MFVNKSGLLNIHEMLGIWIKRNSKSSTRKFKIRLWHANKGVFYFVMIKISFDFEESFSNWTEMLHWRQNSVTLSYEWLCSLIGFHCLSIFQNVLPRGRFRLCQQSEGGITCDQFNWIQYDFILNVVILYTM